MTEFDKLPSKASTRTMYYAGIGSRETPKDIMIKMTAIAKYLESIGYTLRTGDADGADKAFREGCLKKEVYTAKDANEVTIAIAKEIHPAPKALKPYPMMLMARNTFQVFGEDLDLPIDFLIAWTPDGLEHYNNRTQKSGGTGQAIEMASRKGIPIINMFNADWRERLKTLIV